MSGTTHVRYEILRTFRNPRSLAVTMALPLVVYYSVAGANRHAITSGISFPLYFMAAMAAYGAMFATVSAGGHLTIDRAGGWTRQLRVTPLRARTEIAAKVLAAYLVALAALALLFVAGVTLGVHLDSAQWIVMTGLLLAGLAPFVLMGLILGHLVPSDALVPAVGGIVVVFALFGGVFGSFFNGGALLTFTRLLPSYWLAHAGNAVLLSGDWPREGWIVVAGWTVVLTVLATVAYRCGTERA